MYVRFHRGEMSLLVLFCARSVFSPLVSLGECDCGRTKGPRDRGPSRYLLRADSVRQRVERGGNRWVVLHIFLHTAHMCLRHAGGEVPSLLW